MDAISNYLALLEDVERPEAEAITALDDELNRLMRLGRDTPLPGATDDERDAPDWEYDARRAVATRRFPSLGYYNIPASISRSLAETEVVVGDAIDDVADIAGDLADARWRFENTTETDALWSFRFFYDHHWGAHANNLRWYLFALGKER